MKMTKYALCITMLVMLTAFSACFDTIDVQDVLQDAPSSTTKIQTLDDLQEIFYRITNNKRYIEKLVRQEPDGTWTHAGVFGASWWIDRETWPERVANNAYGLIKTAGGIRGTLKNITFVTPHIYDAPENAWHFWQVYAKNHLAENATGRVKVSDRHCFHFASTDAWHAFIAHANANGGIAKMDGSTENVMLRYQDAWEYQAHLSDGTQQTFVFVKNLHIPIAYSLHQRTHIVDFWEVVDQGPADPYHHSTFGTDFELPEFVYRWEPTDAHVFPRGTLVREGLYSTPHLYNSGETAWQFWKNLLHEKLIETAACRFNRIRSRSAFYHEHNFHFTSEAAFDAFIKLANENGGITQLSGYSDEHLLQYHRIQRYQVDTGNGVTTFVGIKYLNFNGLHILNNVEALCSQINE